MYNPADPFSLSDNPLYCLFQDRDGGMWAGSYFGGVNYLPNTNPLFERFVPQGNMHGRRVRESVLYAVVLKHIACLAWGKARQAM